jgi:hypothetical protein
MAKFKRKMYFEKLTTSPQNLTKINKKNLIILLKEGLQRITNDAWIYNTRRCLKEPISMLKTVFQ